MVQNISLNICNLRWLLFLVAVAPSSVGVAREEDRDRTLLERVEGRSYYDMTPISCRANAPGRPWVKSWTNRIQFHEGRVLIWGNICNDIPVTESFRPEDFDLNQDLSSLVYKAKQFEFHEQPPKLCEAGQWCPE
jgi:hypothetical protein